MKPLPESGTAERGLIDLVRSLPHARKEPSSALGFADEFARVVELLRDARATVVEVGRRTDDGEGWDVTLRLDVAPDLEGEYVLLPVSALDPEAYRPT